MEAAGALLKEALEAEKKDNVAETARKRAAQAAAAASAPVPREAAAEAETAVPEQE